MSSIDRRVVDMQFNNKDFQKNALDTVKTLDDLKAALNFDGVGDAASAVEGSAGKFSLGGIVDNVKNMLSNFPILGVVGATALGKLTSAAIDFGQNFVAGVVKPLTEGGWNRAMNLEQAKFLLEGLGVAWDDVSKKILYGVKDTAFGLDSAAKAAASLVASQVSLDFLPTALRSISGVAALTSSSYDDIADVFTKVAGQGRLMGDDLNRLSARGLNAAAQLAKAFGISQEEVRKLVSEGKISFQEFAQVMDDAFGEHATNANQTYTGALSNMNAALARIGAEGAMIKMESHRRMFNALTPVINKVSEALMPMWALLGAGAEKASARFERAMQWILDKFGDDFVKGSAAFWKGIQNITDFIGKLGTTVVDAWQKVFPSDGGTEASTFFTNLGEGFEGLTGLLEHLDGPLRIFGKVLTGVFTGLKVGADAAIWVGDKLKTAWDWLWDFGSGAVSSIWAWLEDSGTIDAARLALESFLTTASGAWETLKDWAAPYLEYLGTLRIDTEKVQEVTETVVDALVAGWEWVTEAVTPAYEAVRDFFTAIPGWVSDSEGPLAKIADFFNSIFGPKKQGMSEGSGLTGLEILQSGFKHILETLSPTLGEIWESLSGFFSNVTGLLSNVSGKQWAGLAAIAGLVVWFITIKKTMDQVLGMWLSLKGLVDAASGTLNSISGYFNAMKTQMKVNNILKIAGAIAILAGSVWLLAQIPPDDLWRAVAAMGAIAAIVAGLMLVEGLASKMKATSVAAPRLLATSLALLALTYSLKPLVDAVMDLGALDGGSLAKGIAGVVLLIGSLGFLLIALGKIGAVNTVSLLVAVGGLVAVMWSVTPLVEAVKTLGEMRLGDLTKGVVALLGLLAGIGLVVGLLAYLSPASLLGSASIALVAITMEELAGAVKILGDMDAEAAKQGVETLAEVFDVVAWGTLKTSLGIIGGINMAIVAGSLLDLAKGVNAFSTIKSVPASLPVSMQLIGDALQRFPFSLFKGANFAIVANNLEEMARGVKAFEGIKSNVPAYSAMLVLGKALNEFPWNVFKGINFTLVANGLGDMADGVAKFSNIPFNPSVYASISLLGRALNEFPMELLKGVNFAIVGANLFSMSRGLMGMSQVPANNGAAQMVYALGIALDEWSVFISKGFNFALVSSFIGDLATGLKKWNGITIGAGVATSVAQLGIALGKWPWSLLQSLNFGILVGPIGNLGDALKKWNGVRLGSDIGDTVGKLAEAIKKFPWTTLGSANTFASMVGPIGDMGDALKKWVGLRIPVDLATQLDRLISAIARLGDKSIATAGDNAPAIKSVGEALRAWNGLNIPADLGGRLIGLATGLRALNDSDISGLTGSLNGVSTGLGRFIGVAGTQLGNFVTILATVRKRLVTELGLYPQAVATSFSSMVTTISRYRAPLAAATTSAVGGISSVLTSSKTSLAGAAYSAGYTIGSNLGRGMVNGVYAQAGNVRAAAYNIASAAASSARRALDINSPSRVGVWIGEMFDAGIAQGIIKHGDQIDAASTKMANDSISHLRDAINEIGDSVFNELDVDPTIRPVLDLSGVAGQASALSSMLNPALVGAVAGKAAAVAGGTFTTPVGDPVAPVTKIDFNQTNTSPKALPASEIYRNTKNGLSVLRDRLEKS